MGMDPTTGQFLDELAKDAAEEEKGWTVFHIGELISIKGQPFRVVDIARTHVVLRSAASECGEVRQPG